MRSGLLVGLGGVALACGGRATLELPSPVAHTSATALDFGLSDCGATGAPVTLTVTNDATALPLSWTATIEGPFALVGPTQGSLTSHESATLEVVPEVPTTAEAAMPVAGTLKLVTNDPRNPELRIPLAAVARGASLSFPASVDFGDIPVTASSPAVPIAFKNLGNAAVDVDVGVPSSPDFVRIAGALHLEPGQEASASYRFSPSQWMVETSSAAVTTKGPVCGAPLQPLALTGRGTKGVVLTSPGKLDFGLVDCGTQTQPKHVVVQNTGNASFDVTAALASGASFTVSPTVGTLPPGASLTLTVTPSGVPAVSAVTPDLYADTLTITTTALGDLPHVVDLRETARGAILDLTPTVQAGRALIDGVKTMPFSITNTGNANVNLSAASTDGVFVVPATAVPANGQPVSATVEVRPVPLMIGRDDTRTLAVTAGPLCNVPPVPSATVHGYDTALDVDVHRQLTCVVGHSHRVYCQGYPAGFPLPIPQPTGDMDWVPGALADHAFATDWEFCTVAAGQATCSVGGTPYVFPLPPVYTELFPSIDPVNFHVCLTAPSSPLQCFGYNTLGPFGDGSTSGDWLAPVIAMGSAPDVVAYSGNAGFGCAVLATGGVLCAGQNHLGSLGNASAPAEALILDPVSVDGITDALRISVAPYQTWNACVARTNGKVSCWGAGSSTATEVGTFTDAADLVVMGPTAGCALRSGGIVRCWGSGSIGDGLGNQPYHEADIALAGPVQKLVGGWNAVCAIEVGGKVECFGVSPAPLMGFEGP